MEWISSRSSRRKEDWTVRRTVWVRVRARTIGAVGEKEAAGEGVIGEASGEQTEQSGERAVEAEAEKEQRETAIGCLDDWRLERDWEYLVVICNLYVY